MNAATCELCHRTVNPVTRYCVSCGPFVLSGCALLGYCAVWFLAGTKDQAIAAASIGFGVTLLLSVIWWRTQRDR